MTEEKGKKVFYILVVDDEVEICKILKKCLSANKHKVKTSSKSQEAIEWIKKEYFDVVFLDIMMPGISGVEILEEIKKVSPDIKIIMMTGKMIDRDFVKKMKDKGAWECIQKPFKLGDIEKILISFI